MGQPMNGTLKFIFSILLTIFIAGTAWGVNRTVSYNNEKSIRELKPKVDKILALEKDIEWIKSTLKEIKDLIKNGEERQ